MVLVNAVGESLCDFRTARGTYVSSAICMIAGKEMSVPQAIRETRMR